MISLSFLLFSDNDTDKLKINLAAIRMSFDRIENRNDHFGATEKFGKD
jgi:hypothetical protein